MIFNLTEKKKLKDLANNGGGGGIDYQPQIDAIDAKITTIELHLNDNDGKITQLDVLSGNNKNAITTLETKVDKNAKDIAQDISDINDRIDNLPTGGGNLPPFQVYFASCKFMDAEFNIEKVVDIFGNPVNASINMTYKTQCITNNGTNIYSQVSSSSNTNKISLSARNDSANYAFIYVRASINGNIYVSSYKGVSYDNDDYDFISGARIILTLIKE